MPDGSEATKNLRERLGAGTEDRLGRALGELLENPLLTGAIGRAFDAREKAAQAQEVALGALNIPTAADVERLTRRLRSLSHRLESIEDGVARLEQALVRGGVEARLERIESQLAALGERLEHSPPEPARRRKSSTASRKPSTASRKPSTASGKSSTGSREAASGSHEAASGSHEAGASREAPSPPGA